MSTNESDFRQRLLDAQDMTPALRDAYRNGITELLQHKLTLRTRLLLTPLLLATLAFTAVGLRALLFYYRGAMLYGVWMVFTCICAAAAVWIGAAIWRGRYYWSSLFSVADAFAVAAVVMTVLMLVAGTRAASDPASTFGVLYALTLLITCIGWSVYNRIAAAELCTREHALRIECRLADLSRRLGGSE